MQALWQHSPISVREVMQRLPEDNEWAYSTVKTLLTRLAEKQVLTVSKQGNSSYFAPLLTRAQARRSAIHQLIDRAFDGTVGGLVQHLLEKEKLTGAQREELQAILGDEDTTNAD